jgi:hypothetical protein
MLLRLLKKVRSEYAPWITSEIKNMMDCRDFLKRKAVKTGSKQFHDAFTETQNELNKWTFPLITKILIKTKISSQLERASQN